MKGPKDFGNLIFDKQIISRVCIPPTDLNLITSKLHVVASRHRLSGDLPIFNVNAVSSIMKHIMLLLPLTFGNRSSTLSMTK